MEAFKGFKYAKQLTILSGLIIATYYGIKIYHTHLQIKDLKKDDNDKSEGMSNFI